MRRYHIEDGRLILIKIYFGRREMDSTAFMTGFCDYGDEDYA
jgi:hypothetical protein